MTPLSTVIGQVAALTGMLALVLTAPRIRLLQRWRTVIAGLLAALALAAYVDLGRLHPVGIWVHYWDTFHYLVSAKYFDELGYDGLYEATVIADTEDDPESLIPQIPIRSLSTYEMESRGAIAARAHRVRARFSEERWAAFKADIAWFRAIDPLQWRNSHVLIDHGFNGTPTLAAFLGAIANGSGLSLPTLAWVLSFSDLAVLMLLAALVAWRLDAELGALIVLVWAANPLNDFQVIGGAPFRSLHVLLLMGGAVALGQGRDRLSGAAAGLAAGLRVLPGAIAAATVGWTLLGRTPEHRDARIARWLIACLLAGAVAAGIGARLEAPDGRMAWLPFVEKLELHGTKLSPNVVSLRYPFLYDDTHNARVVEASWPDGERLNWVDETSRTLARRWNAYQAAALATGILVALLLWRGRLEDAWAAGLLVPFVALHPSHYEWAVLAVLPVLYRRNRPALALLLAGLASIGLVRFVPAIEGVLDRRFLAQSLVVWALFVSLAALRLSQEARASRSTGPADATGPA